MSDTGTARTLRSDAQRNRDALLEAGKVVFAEEGAEAPFEDVARVASVGKGTLYRHFPTRDHLVAAIMQDRFTALTEEADALASGEDALAALEQWLRDFDRSPVRYRGMSSRVGDGIADAASAVSSACAPMKESFTRLLARSQRAGAVREDIEATSLLTMVSSLPQTFRNEDGSSPLLDVVLRGLRAG